MRNPTNATPPRVLVVDDEPRNLSLLEALLAGEHVWIELASSGREALEAFTRAQDAGGIDLVLLDVMMPEMDGLTTLRELRARTPAGERIPIVLVTALGEREDRLRGLEAGADDFLTKPLDPNEVRCRVRTFLALRGAQRELRARLDELAALQKGREELAHMLVHDLKNPIAAVSANLDWITRRLGKLGVADGALREAVVDAKGSAEQLVRMIGSLVEIERAEAGRLEAKLSRQRLGRLLTEIARRHAKVAEARSVSLVVDVDEALEAEVDPDLVDRIVENLLENATRYTPSGGRIAVAAEAGASALEISVSNEGVAIPEELRAKIFEKHSSTESSGVKSRNLGLGLYFCRLAAEVMGGTIVVESTPEWPVRFVVQIARRVRRSMLPSIAPRRPPRAAFLDG